MRRLPLLLTAALTVTVGCGSQSQTIREAESLPDLLCDVGDPARELRLRADDGERTVSSNGLTFAASYGRVDEQRELVVEVRGEGGDALERVTYRIPGAAGTLRNQFEPGAITGTHEIAAPGSGETLRWRCRVAE